MKKVCFVSNYAQLKLLPLRGTPFGFFFDNFDHALYFLSFMAIKKGSMSNYQDL